MNRLGFAKLAITMAVLYELLLIVLIFLRPDLPVYSTTISEWAIGKFGWLMQGAFLTSALGYLFLGLALHGETQGFWGKTGWILLFICFLGTTGVGLFVTNPYPPDLTITTTLIHTISGTLAMVLLPIAAILICFNLANKGVGWTKHKKSVKWIGLIPLLVFAGFIIHLNLYIIPLGKNGVGPNVPIGYPPRILFFSYHLWLVLLACRLIQFKQSNQK
ncbi:MAG TPA: DUF998 domain-containing protein [Mucilaginibacter sp.]|nr:DUF998 domain-containing protein [Mucilaginibacter sp.]